MTDEENIWYKSGKTINWSDAKDINLAPPTPNCVDFFGVVKIYSDCRVEIAEEATLDDATRAFWEGIKEIAPFLWKDAVETEREACAEVAEHPAYNMPRIAAAIRARGKNESIL